MGFLTPAPRCLPLFCLCAAGLTVPMLRGRADDDRRPAYDGPVGVNFQAPLVERVQGTGGIFLESLVVRSEVRRDTRFDSRAPENRRRAFPDGFTATRAETWIELRLATTVAVASSPAGAAGTPSAQRAGQPAPVPSHASPTLRLLFPFTASRTEGTGFTLPDSFRLELEGQPVRVRKIDLQVSRGSLVALRGYLTEVPLPAAAAATLRARAVHSLALNPSWYSFTFQAARPLARFRPLLAPETRVEWAIAAQDSVLRGWDVRLRLCTLAVECREQVGKLGDFRLAQPAVDARPAAEMNQHGWATVSIHRQPG
ncbi:MAG: hypothetical protein HY703_06305 [Gemmatimonadetes bacterium]|nr:hypothetical protein [Gemmatimonadota bacterium]